MPTASNAAAKQQVFGMVSTMRHKLKWVRYYGSSAANLIANFLHFFYFPEETILYQDVLTRTMFAMYYLPVMAIVIAITHSFAQNVVHALIIPVIQAIEEEADKRAVSLTQPTSELSEVLTELWIKLLPYGVLTMCVVAFSHKILNCLGEAMVDAFSTHDGKDYPLLATRMRFVLETRNRILTFSIVLLSTSFLCLSVFATNFFVVWSARAHQVLVAAWTIVVSCLLFIIWTVILRFRYVTEKQSLSTVTPKDSDAKHYGYYFTGFWWRTSIHRIRFFAVEMLAVFCLYWIFTVGLLDTISFAVEVLMYLNLPHIFGFFVLYVTTATTRVIQSYKWIGRHPEYMSSVTLMAAPYFSLQIYALFYFGAYIPTMAAIGLSMVFLWARAIDLARESDVNPERGGRVMWREKVSRDTLPLYYAAVLEDAFERKKSEPGVVSIEKTVDLKHMVMFRRGRSPVDIERLVRNPAYHHHHHHQQQHHDKQGGHSGGNKHSYIKHLIGGVVGGGTRSGHMSAAGTPTTPMGSSLPADDDEEDEHYHDASLRPQQQEHQRGEDHTNHKRFHNNSRNSPSHPVLVDKYIKSSASSHIGPSPSSSSTPTRNSAAAAASSSSHGMVADYRSAPTTGNNNNKNSVHQRSVLGGYPINSSSKESRSSLDPSHNNTNNDSNKLCDGTRKKEEDTSVTNSKQNNAVGRKMSMLSPVETRALLWYGIPRLLLLQSAGTFGGRRFTNVRIVLRAFTGTLMVLFFVLVSGVVLQASVPALRPLPMRVEFLKQPSAAHVPTHAHDDGVDSQGYHRRRIVTMIVDHLLVVLRVEGIVEYTDETMVGVESDMKMKKPTAVRDIDTEQGEEGESHQSEGVAAEDAFGWVHYADDEEEEDGGGEPNNDEDGKDTLMARRRRRRNNNNHREEDTTIRKIATTLKENEEAAAMSSAPSTTASHHHRHHHHHHHDHHHHGPDVYPGLCAKTFTQGKVPVWELAWIALLPYLSTDDDVVQMLSFLNQYMDTDWALQPRYGSSDDDDSGLYDDDDEEEEQEDDDGVGTEADSGAIESEEGSSSAAATEVGSSHTRRGRRHQLTEWRGYVEVYSLKRNVSAVGVRGTDLTAFVDMLQDVNMFFEAGLYQVLSNIVPGTSLLPSSLVTDFIKVVTMVQEFATPEVRTWRKLGMGRFKGFEQEAGDVDAVLLLRQREAARSSASASSSSTSASRRKEEKKMRGARHSDADDDDQSGGGVRGDAHHHHHQQQQQQQGVSDDCSTTRDYYISVYNHVKFLLHADPPQPPDVVMKEQQGGQRRSRRRNIPADVVLTGHSLGGAITHIVGAKLGLQSVAFSAPGIVLSHKKFGVSLENIHRYTFTVMSSHDIVPHIGWQGGELHNVECRAQTRELCHAMEFMIGTLWHSCGSVRERYSKIRSVQ